MEVRTDSVDREQALRYVRGDMSAEEEAAFEAHFLDNPDLLAELELDLIMRVALESVSEETSRRKPANPVWFLRPTLSPLAAAAIVTVVAVVMVFGANIRIANERAEFTQALTAPRGNVGVLTLAQTRSTAPMEVPPVVIPNQTDSVLVQVLLDYPESDTYRLTLLSAGAEAGPLSVNDVVPQGGGELRVLLDSADLPSGSYELLVEERREDLFTEVARLEFVIERR